MTNINIKIDDKLYQKFKIKATKQGKKVKYKLIEMIEKEVK